MRIEAQWNSLFPLYIPYVASGIEGDCTRKWRPPVEADDRIVGDLRAALVACGHCAGMISVLE